mmetsp:Transcript_22747/g.38858  ORF Transcript_22747/g.38858 Transcript_22747/m.38858 type:complete len:634 (-) Transcript_22747:256-2157(-)
MLLTGRKESSLIVLAALLGTVHAQMSSPSMPTDMPTYWPTLVPTYTTAPSLGPTHGSTNASPSLSPRPSLLSTSGSTDLPYQQIIQFPTSMPKDTLPVVLSSKSPSITSTLDGSISSPPPTSSSPSLSSTSKATDLPFLDIIQFPTPVPIDTVTDLPFLDIIEFPAPPAPGAGSAASEPPTTKIPTYMPTIAPTPFTQSPTSSSSAPTISNEAAASYSPSLSVSTSEEAVTYSPSSSAANTTGEASLSSSAAPTSTTTSGGETSGDELYSFFPTWGPTVSDLPSSSILPTSGSLPTDLESSLSSSPTTMSTPSSTSPTLGSSSNSTETGNDSSSASSPTSVPTNFGGSLSPTAATTTSVPTLRPIDATNEPTTSQPTFAAPSSIKIYTGSPSASPMNMPYLQILDATPTTTTTITTATALEPIPSPSPSLPEVPTTLRPTREPIVFHMLYIYHMGHYHKKKSIENHIPHVGTHDKLEAKYAEDYEKDPTYAEQFVEDATYADKFVEAGMDRVTSPHMVIESEAANHLKKEENPVPNLFHDKEVSYARSFVSDEDVARVSSPPHLFGEGEDVVRVSSPHLFGGSEAAQRLENEIQSPDGHMSLNYRVRMTNGSRGKMWNNFVAIGSFGITWMLS